MWSMPRSVLRVVAVIIAVLAVGGFVMGLRNAPDRGRLPGEGPDATPGVAIQAPDAEILDTDERPAPPPEKTPEELAAEEAAKKQEEEARAALDAAKLVDAAPPPVKTAPLTPPPPVDDKVGDLIDGLTPPPEQPPY